MSAELDLLETRVFECTERVSQALDQKVNSRYVNRFGEKNTLTFSCMDKYELWFNAATNYLQRSSAQGEDITQKKATIQHRNEALQENLTKTFELATTSEEKSFDALILKVEAGTKLAARKCPFQNGGTGFSLPENRKKAESTM